MDERDDEWVIYLLQPHTRLTYIDVPSQVVDAVLDQGDLTNLSWLPSERAASDTLLRLALRYGHAVRGVGIAVSGQIAVMAFRPAELMDVAVAAQRSQDALRDGPEGALIERLLPGSAAHGCELDARVAESTAAQVEQARARVDTAVRGRPVSTEVAAQWVALGGRVPVDDPCENVTRGRLVAAIHPDAPASIEVRSGGQAVSRARTPPRPRQHCA